MNNQYQLLLLTDEGQQLLARFAKSVGCDFAQMNDEQASNWIDQEHKALFAFLAGVMFTFSKI